MTTASETIRETRISLFEGKWGVGAYSDGSSNTARRSSDAEEHCILSHMAKVVGTECWASLHWDGHREALECIVEAIEREHAAIFDGCWALCPIDRVWAFNDGVGRTFDEIVHVLDVAEKFAEQKEQANG